MIELLEEGAAHGADLKAEADAALAAAPIVDVGIAPAAPAIDPAREAAENRAALAGLLSITFNDAIAPRLGAHWALTESQAKSLGDAYATVLDKYFPNWSTGPEVAAIVVSFAVFGPRAATTIAERRNAARSAEEKQSAATVVA